MYPISENKTRKRHQNYVANELQPTLRLSMRELLLADFDIGKPHKEKNVKYLPIQNRFISSWNNIIIFVRGTRIKSG